MPIGINAIDLRKPSETEATAEVIPDILLKAEITQRIVDKKFPSDSLKGERNLTGIPPGQFNQAMAIMDNFCKEAGYVSPSRNILKTLSRITPVVESHGFIKKNREFEKKWKIDGNVQEQKSIQISQGTTNLVGGAATLVFKALAALPQWGNIFEALSNIPQYAIPTITNYYDAKRTPLSHEQSFFLNTTQAERQAIESLKQLPESLRNLALELMRLKVREAENIFQR